MAATAGKRTAMPTALLLSTLLLDGAAGFVLHARPSGFTTASASATFAASQPAAGSLRMEFGDSFYEGFEHWAAQYPEEDKQNYPEYFVLPEGVYETSLQRPLGIAFEEVEPGRGVVVTDLIEGGNAASQGKIKIGDILLASTAIKVIGAKFERKLIPCRELNLDTIMGAIGSNEPRWQCRDVILQFQRADAPADEVNAYLERIELPADSPWRS